MTVFQHIQSNYNYYPTTCIELCVISYQSQSAIADAVSANTNLDVCWGPYELTHWDGIAYSLMYVAKNAATGEYFVVIRGTNPDSLSSWLLQDFDVSTTQPFSSLPGSPPNVSSKALLSQGAFNGMSDLISLPPSSNGIQGENVVDFLKDEQPTYLYVTGHSLGGTLTPPMFAYLNAMLYDGAPINNMALWSFAGLTPGDTGFNAYLNGLFPAGEEYSWRFHNSLDIAPLLFYDQSGIENIYSAHDLSWGEPESSIIEKLFSDAHDAGVTYAQPQTGQSLTGLFVDTFPDEYSWVLQAFHQHHSTTYQTLVDAAFPVSSEAAVAGQGEDGVSARRLRES